LQTNKGEILPDIHSTALVSPKAEIGGSASIGAYAIIEADVKIGEGTVVQPFAVIKPGVTIGRNCKIFNNAIIGSNPQDLKFDDEKTFVTIGDNTTVREFATINRATTHSYYTRVGNDCLIMAYVHVAHDCQIGNEVVLANAVNLAGHVIIDDFVGIGGLTPVHQFVRIGAYSFIGGGLKIAKDVPPFILAMGDPLTYGGLNSVGLKRRGFSADTMSVLKKAYKILYREGLLLKDAIEKIDGDIKKSEEIERLLNFLRGSKRGIIR
jgi:UDP-N-acetylglucosamine acyltransferase